MSKLYIYGGGRNEGTRVFDRKELAMGKAWLTINNLRKHIFKVLYAPFLLTLAITEEIEENFMKR